MPAIESVSLTIGMEIHVELSTRSKMFTRVGSPACREFEDAEPNTLIDPVVLALPGALPVLNREAIELSVRVGLALGCEIPERTKWDRKGYYYPDLPKAYQLSQYDMPLCGEGAVEWPIGPDGEHVRIGITRAHLEEDAGKLLHEWPGGRSIDHSIVDLNRAGTPLLEIVTEPDFTTSEQCVAFAQMLRDVCRSLGVTEGDMQRGHMRFEPNINTTLTLDDGRTIKTPIVEIKNLNSFRSLAGAIAFELKAQPQRWLEDGKELGAGTKSTRGWDDDRMITFLQREKEDAHDYRYFPDPDLLPVHVSRHWVEQVRSELPPLPHELIASYRDRFGLATKESKALVEEPADHAFFIACIDASPEPAHKTVVNLVLQSARRIANERGCAVAQIGISADQLAQVAVLRTENAISASGADTLLQALCERDDDAEPVARELGLVQVTDTSQIDAWVAQVLEDPANAKAVEDVRSGKMAAAGRLIGAVMQLSSGSADAKQVRQRILDSLS